MVYLLEQTSPKISGHSPEHVATGNQILQIFSLATWHPDDDMEILLSERRISMLEKRGDMIENDHKLCRIGL